MGAVRLIGIKPPGHRPRKMNAAHFPERAMFPTQITLRNLRPSPVLSARIRDLCEKLGHLHPRILNCRVAIEQPIVRTRRGTRVREPVPYFVDVQVRLPGTELVAQPQVDAELEIAIRKAFVLVRRQLREFSVHERDNAHVGIDPPALKRY